MSDHPPSPVAPPVPRPLAHGELTGAIDAALQFADAGALAQALTTILTAPAGADGRRNQLWPARLATADGELAVMVKAFGREHPWHRLRRRLGASKAERSFRSAQAVLAAGVATPAPIAWLAAPDHSCGFYVCHLLTDAVEARYPLRALNLGAAELAARFPWLDGGAFLTAAGALARRLHDAGIWHRDYSPGNLLLTPPAASGTPPAIALVDLNRARLGRPLGLRRRMGDLVRLPLAHDADQAALLAGYFAPAPVPAAARAAYRRARRAFVARQEAKRRWRDRLARWRGRLLSRGTHAHIPAAAPGLGRRERAVWDALSDQPHLHAGRWEKVGLRLLDLPAHARALVSAGTALPRLRRTLRELEGAALKTTRIWSPPGIAVRPWPADPDALLATLADLGTRRVLVRLHPWEDGAARDGEVAFAEELARRGFELSFAVPQNRELVRDPGRWAAANEELAARLGPLATGVQLLQAINRSKWGVWTLGEYAALLAPAVAAWRRAAPAATLLGGAVIDFEPHATAAVANLAGAARVDGLAHLLYVDRRGAPENRQLGRDALGKALLLRALTACGRACGPASWVTEVNWPLAEGPYSPAGRLVAVDEERQADYLVRYCLLLLAGGGADRVYWWQLFAKGYGLVDPLAAGAPRRRPAFRALATLLAQLADSRFVGRLPTPAGSYLLRFATAEAHAVLVGWAVGPGTVAVSLPAPARCCLGRDGEGLATRGDIAELAARPRYWWC